MNEIFILFSIVLVVVSTVYFLTTYLLEERLRKHYPEIYNQLVDPATASLFYSMHGMGFILNLRAIKKILNEWPGVKTFDSRTNNLRYLVLISAANMIVPGMVVAIFTIIIVATK